MRYNDHCHTLLLELKHQIQQGFGIGLIQG